MARPPIEEPTLDDRGEENHPAFGVASVTRSQGTPRTLFQSDLQHNHTINLTISGAKRRRDLNSDFVHPADSIVEVEMSLAQWGALVSSMGIGSGVPVTIRRRPEERSAATGGLPYEPRMVANLNEVRTTTEQTLAGVQEAFDDLDEAIETKAGVKVIRQKRQHLRSAIANAGPNAEYAVKSLIRASDAVVSQARADVESHVLQAAQLTGTSPVQAPMLNQSVPGNNLIEATDNTDDEQ